MTSFYRKEAQYKMIKLMNNIYKVIKDMKNLFPKDVRKEMEKVHQDGTIKRLMLDIDNQTKLYFHK